MSKEEIIAWLDTQVTALRMAKTELGEFRNYAVSDCICDCNTHEVIHEDAIHTNNIELLTEVTHTELIDNSSERYIEKYIVYKGVAFFEFATREEEDEDS